VHLVGVIIRIYHDARSPERQKKWFRLTKYYRFVTELSIKHNDVVVIKHPVFGEFYPDYNLEATNRYMIS